MPKYGHGIHNVIWLLDTKKADIHASSLLIVSDELNQYGNLDIRRLYHRTIIYNQTISIATSINVEYDFVGGVLFIRI